MSIFLKIVFDFFNGTLKVRALTTLIAYLEEYLGYIVSLRQLQLSFVTKNPKNILRASSDTCN
ncbi:hypothetical protein DIU36_22285 [Mucilaginibacter rubeus]|nr:hypothetical protein DIU36_22285 [Mucilaginibacter rubeus]